jgi:hypothetical protein
MGRNVLDFFARHLEGAYRTDPFHALRRNLEAVRPEEWDIRPANPSIGPQGEFGTDPVLSICELALHVGGAKHMYANRAFGDGSLQWGQIPMPSFDMPAVLAWIDDGHQALAIGLETLTDDSALQASRLAPWNTPLRVEQLLSIVINHDLYHSGEINRQRGLIRGSDGWEHPESTARGRIPPAAR